MRVRFNFDYWRQPLACPGHAPAHQHSPWPSWKLFAVGPLIPLHKHKPMGPGVKAWRVWLYTRAGGRLIDLRLVPTSERRSPPAA